MTRLAFDRSYDFDGVAFGNAQICAHRTQICAHSTRICACQIGIHRGDIVFCIERRIDSCCIDFAHASFASIVVVLRCFCDDNGLRNGIATRSFGFWRFATRSFGFWRLLRLGRSLVVDLGLRLRFDVCRLIIDFSRLIIDFSRLSFDICLLRFGFHSFVAVLRHDNGVSGVFATDLRATRTAFAATPCLCVVRNLNIVRILNIVRSLNVVCGLNIVRSLRFGNRISGNRIRFGGIGRFASHISPIARSSIAASFSRYARHFERRFEVIGLGRFASRLRRRLDIV